MLKIVIPTLLLLMKTHWHGPLSCSEGRPGRACDHWWSTHVQVGKASTDPRPAAAARAAL